LRIAGCAFGVNGMLPPSYTRRVGVNPWRFAYTRQRHLERASVRLAVRAEVTYIESRDLPFGVAYIESLGEGNARRRFALAASAYATGAGNACWGCR
jgi:hypothetical protein